MEIDDKVKSEIRKLKKQDLPSIDDFKRQNKELEAQEKDFLKKVKKGFK